MPNRVLAKIITKGYPTGTDPLFFRNTDSGLNFASYFNAFPASYWQNNTELTEIGLQLLGHGDGQLYIFRSDHEGTVQVATSAPLIDGVLLQIPLPLTSFSAGGWYWFTIETEDPKFTLVSGSWTTTAEPVRPGTLSIGITTLDKADYCIRNLNLMAADSELLDALEHVYVVDQGKKKLREHPEFEAVSEKFAEKLQVIEQSNFGGSGGFARSMVETLTAGKAKNHLLIDDDVTVQTESILRAHRFAQYTRSEVIVGGHMFDLNKPTIIHAFSEIVEEREFLWTQRSKIEFRHDFAEQSLIDTPWFHQYLPADYNGWWMCLIPRNVLTKIGLAMPYFLKWDDAEYGLRAKKLEVSTVSLPGVALWHVSWLDKNDAQDWQAYFHQRNRLITALLHGKSEHRRSITISSTLHSMKQLLALEYYSVKLRNLALHDLLQGPRILDEVSDRKLKDALSIKSGYGENMLVSAADKPEAKTGIHEFANIEVGRPTGARLYLWFLNKFPKHYFTNTHPNVAIPEAEFRKLQSRWWRVGKFDSYTVESASSDGYYIFRRDRKKFRELLRESNRLHRQLAKNWHRLASEYQAASQTQTSLAFWQERLGVKAEGN